MRVDIPAEDLDLATLRAEALPSTTEPEVRYRLERLLGRGAMGFAYFGMRETPDGRSPVVIKLLRPEYVLKSKTAGALVVEKEVTALSRLNARVPPTPFVVRMVDAGAVEVRVGGVAIDLPWLALEYVHGGAEGTTLTDRVTHTAERTGYGFDPARAAHAVDCMAKGIDAIHEVGVLHRDLTPNNVLCCGFGDDEIFKIADFGLARPVGVAATFGGIVVGTLGYAPPEQAGLDDRRIGTWSDVFTFAVDVYFMLTGRAYFEVGGPADILRVVREPTRKSIRDSPLLSPELVADPAACDGIDRALAQATAFRPEERPQTGALFAATLLPWLRQAAPRSSVSRRVDSVTPVLPREGARWRWTIRHRASGDRVVRSIAWDGDGKCLAATSDGLAFWNGTGWQPAPSDALPNPTGIRFVQRVGAGRWLVGGDGATMATYSSSGVSDVVQGPSATETFVLADGDFDDLAVMVGTRPNGPPVLYTLSSRRWLKPLPLSKAAAVTGLARVSDERWLVTGRRNDGRGFAAEVRPLQWDAVEVPVPPVRALLACAARIDRDVAVAVGSDGLVVTLSGGSADAQTLAGEPDLASTAIDVVGRIWAAGARGLWLREGLTAPFQQLWSDPGIEAPIVSLFADPGVVVAAMADGSMLEGRYSAGDA